MALSERISTISRYFKTMEITGDEEKLVYIAVAFPDKWKINQDIISQFIDVKLAKQDGLTYFFTSINNGETILFDAIDAVIKDNVEAEERVKLFQEKTKQLQEIFATQVYTLEDLRDLEFTFNKTKDFIEDARETVDTYSGMDNFVDEVVETNSEVNSEDVTVENKQKKSRKKN